jgi:hypothetical protein
MKQERIHVLSINKVRGNLCLISNSAFELTENGTSKLRVHSPMKINLIYGNPKQ